MLRPFTLHRPASVAEAIGMRRTFGSDGAVYAGGTELLLVMKEGLAHWPHLIDVKGLPGLDALAFDAARRRLVVGATVTHRRIERSALVRERFPTLGDMATQVANVRVRNVGTLGGNLCFAEPHADPATLLAAYGAEVVLAGPGGERHVPVSAFVTGPYETALGPEELLVRVEIPEPPARAAGAYVKFGLHERPTLSVAVLLTLVDGATGAGAREGRIEQARVVVGCVGPTATALPDVEARVRGLAPREIGDAGALARGAGEAVDAVSDLHGSADYKRHLVDVFVARALAQAARRAGALAA